MIHSKNGERNVCHFELHLDRPASDDEVERLFDSCDDASFGATAGVGYAAFSRQAGSLEQAIRLAAVDLATEDLKVTDVRLVDPLLSRLVSVVR